MRWQNIVWNADSTQCKCFHQLMMSSWSVRGRNQRPPPTCGGKMDGASKRNNGMFEGVSGTKQAAGYKRVRIILSKLQECKAWNKLAQITHRGVWYINSHFRSQTKREKKNLPPTENGIPSCESQAIYGMHHFPALKYPLSSFFSLCLSVLTDSKSYLQPNCEPRLSLTGK